MGVAKYFCKESTDFHGLGGTRYKIAVPAGVRGRRSPRFSLCSPGARLFFPAGSEKSKGSAPRLSDTAYPQNRTAKALGGPFSAAPTICVYFN